MVGGSIPRAQLLLFVVVIGIALVLIVISQASSNAAASSILATLSLLVIVLGVSTKYYYYLINPILKRKGRTLVLNASEAFTLAPSGTAIVVREGVSVYASSFVKIPVYRSATEMNRNEKIELSKLFSRILTLGKTPIKISSQLYVVNKDAYISRIRKKLEDAEDRYGGMQAGAGKAQQGSLDRIRGEVTMWKNLLDNVSKAQSESLTLYAMVSALGGTDEEAINLAYQHAEELAGGISAVLGVGAYVAKGEEILTLIDPEYMIPVGTVSERLRQKAV